MSARALALVLGAAAFAAPFPEPHDNQKEDIPVLQPADALTKLHLPEGFKATLFAAEPDVRQPIAMCWDERGRLWIASEAWQLDETMLKLGRSDLTINARRTPRRSFANRAASATLLRMQNPIPLTAFA